MGLNDEREKIRQARQWLEECDITSQHFRAAWDHIIGIVTASTEAGDDITAIAAWNIAKQAVDRMFHELELGQATAYTMAPPAST